MNRNGQTVDDGGGAPAIFYREKCSLNSWLDGKKYYMKIKSTISYTKFRSCTSKIIHMNDILCPTFAIAAVMLKK